MARLVDDLLDVSRITHGRVELRKERVDLTAVVRGAVETSRPLIEALEHALSVSLPPEPLWLEADPARLEQIVTNLLNNAAKYTEPGGRIWLTAEVEPGIGRRVSGVGSELADPTPDTRYPIPDALVLRVRDSGVGLAPELLPRVFDLFTQADRSLNRSQGGLGLGLTLVRRLAELHGGSVHAESAGPGQGSEFVVRLPLAPLQRVGRRVSGVGSKPAPPTPVPLQGIKSGVADIGSESVSPTPDTRHPTPLPVRVLVVDDNADAAATLAELLVLWGHEVRVVHDGPLALEEASRYQPEVVLLDIGLPRMDGYEVARRLGEQAGRQGLRLVAVTRLRAGGGSPQGAGGGLRRPPGQASRSRRPAPVARDRPPELLTHLPARGPAPLLRSPRLSILSMPLNTFVSLRG